MISGGRRRSLLAPIRWIHMIATWRSRNFNFDILVVTNNTYYYCDGGLNTKSTNTYNIIFMPRTRHRTWVSAGRRRACATHRVYCRVKNYNRSVFSMKSNTYNIIILLYILLYRTLVVFS